MKLRCSMLTGTLLALAVMLSGCPPAKVTYQLTDTVALLAPSFYAGQAGDGSNVAGRQAFFGQSSHDGERIAFWAVNNATGGCSFFIVDVNNPENYRRITPDYADTVPNTPVSWTPDDSALFVAGLRIAIPSEGELSNIVWWPIHGIVVSDACTTSLPSGNWEIAQKRDENVSQIVALPIRADGSEDPWREPVFLTDFSGETLRPDWIAVSPNATQVAFADIDGSSDGSEHDIADVYVLKNIQAILSAPLKPGTAISTLAALDANDNNVVPIRVGESANFAETPAFSQNGKLVIYGEDFNNVFRDSNFLESLSLADFDLMISNSNGTGDDFRIALPGNQAFPSSIPGGNRIVYSSEVDTKMHLFASTLESTSLSGKDFPKN